MNYFDQNLILQNLFDTNATYMPSSHPWKSSSERSKAASVLTSGSVGPYGEGRKGRSLIIHTF